MKIEDSALVSMKILTLNHIDPKASQVTKKLALAGQIEK
jgi:hypothetical protein